MTGVPVIEHVFRVPEVSASVPVSDTIVPRVPEEGRIESVAPVVTVKRA